MTRGYGLLALLDALFSDCGAVTGLPRGCVIKVFGDAALFFINADAQAVCVSYGTVTLCCHAILL